MGVTCVDRTRRGVRLGVEDSLGCGRGTAEEGAGSFPCTSPPVLAEVEAANGGRDDKEVEDASFARGVVSGFPSGEGDGADGAVRHVAGERKAGSCGVCSCGCERGERAPLVAATAVVIGSFSFQPLRNAVHAVSSEAT